MPVLQCESGMCLESSHNCDGGISIPSGPNRDCSANFTSSGNCASIASDSWDFVTVCRMIAPSGRRSHRNTVLSGASTSPHSESRCASFAALGTICVHPSGKVTSAVEFFDATFWSCCQLSTPRPYCTVNGVARNRRPALICMSLVITVPMGWPYRRAPSGVRTFLITVAMCVPDALLVRVFYSLLSVCQSFATRFR